MSIDFKPTPGERQLYVAAAVASVVITILGVATALFSRAVFDHVLPNNGMSSLIGLAIGMVLVLGADITLRVLRSRWVDAAAETADARIASALFERVLRGKMASVPRSHVAAALLTQHETVREGWSGAVVFAAIDAAAVVVYLAVMAMVSGWLVLVPVTGMLVLAASWLIHGRMDAAVRVSAAASARRAQLVHEGAMALEDVKACRAEGKLSAEMHELAMLTAENASHLRGLTNLATTISSSASSMVQIGVLVLGAVLVIDGHITMGVVTAASLLSGRVMAPMLAVSAAIMKLSRAAQAKQQLKAVTDADLENGTEHLALSNVEGAVEFRDVSFLYPGAEVPALSGFNLRLAPGEKVALIGECGSGKTTVGRLLAAFLDVKGDGCKGLVTLDGHSVAQLDVHSLRGHVAFAPQDPSLLTGSLKDNITLAKPDASDDEIAAALKLSGAMGWIAANPAGLGYQVVEQGRNLSGGQRQTLALARLLLTDAKVLVLDEPTAHMDPGSQAAWIAAMKHHAAGKTMLLSTHRMELLQLVDRVVVMQQGRAVGQYTPKEIFAAMQAGQALRPNLVNVKEAA